MLLVEDHASGTDLLCRSEPKLVSIDQTYSCSHSFFHVPLFSTQISSQVAQSVVLGHFADYFGIERPTDEDTRNAYLYALGNLPSFCCCCSFHVANHFTPPTIFSFSYQGLILLGSFIVIIHGHAFLAAYKTGMHSRITLTAAIYQKVMNYKLIQTSSVSSIYSFWLTDTVTKSGDYWKAFHWAYCQSCV